MILKDLNNKIWYRLVKVIYVMIFLSILISFIVGIFSSLYSQPRNTKLQDVKCSNGIVLSEMPSTKGRISEEQNTNKILEKCDGTFTTIKEYTRTRYVTYWWGLIGALLSSIIGIALIFEIIRRIFYYIVLGTFIPEKRKQ